MRLKKRLIGLLVLIALFVTISIALAEKDEIRYNLNNCISVCSDEDGCMCPNYCIKTKDIDYGKNCRGYPGGCSKENTMYWVRDNICSYTCGNSYEEMMLEKGYEKVDYNCYKHTLFCTYGMVHLVFWESCRPLQLILHQKTDRQCQFLQEQWFLPNYLPDHSNTKYTDMYLYSLCRQSSQ